MGNPSMKSRLASALALGLFLAPTLAAPSFAEQPAAEFRTAAPEAFSAEDLQRYGLDSEAADRAVALQDQGYEVMVLSTEEADQYTAGITDSQWILVGILVGVVIIAVAVS